MLPEIKTITKEELEEFQEKKGFVFTSSKASGDSAIKNLCHVLVAREITNSMPDFIFRLDFSTVFVYDSDFDLPAFFAGSQMAENMRICKVELISEFLERAKGQSGVS